jgi:hypothetical protein
MAAAKPKKTKKLRAKKTQNKKTYEPTLMALVMDGTSIAQISHMKNEGYSRKIISKAYKDFDYKKFAGLKNQNFIKYLKEGKKQIVDQWHAIESLSVHNEKFTVRFLINIGTVLKDIEAALKTKSKYMKWLRKNFGHKHMRYFQQAKQLANMGDFAYNEAALGKNRLLAFSQIISDPKTNYQKLLEKYPFEDITEDHGSLVFKQHVDSIITFHRMTAAGVDYIEFAQAELIASILKSAIPVKLADRIAKWLVKFGTVERKKEWFENFILNHLQFPDQQSVAKKGQIKLREHLAFLINLGKQETLADATQIEAVRDLIDRDALMGLSRLIQQLAEKLNIELAPPAGEKVTSLQDRKRRAA